MTDHDPEVDAVVEELQRAGFVTIGTDAEGNETWTLTPTGEQVANQMAMSSEDGAAGGAAREAGLAGHEKGPRPSGEAGPKGYCDRPTIACRGGSRFPEWLKRPR